MAERENRQLPKTSSMDELVELFETHDMGEYMAGMPEVDVEVALERRRHLVALDDDVIERLNTAAREQNIPSETFVNSLLRAKLAKAG